MHQEKRKEKTCLAISKKAKHVFHFYCRIRYGIQECKNMTKYPHSLSYEGMRDNALACCCSWCYSAPEFMSQEPLIKDVFQGNDADGLTVVIIRSNI